MVVQFLLTHLDPDQRESEHPDNDLIWNIQLLAHVSP